MTKDEALDLALEALKELVAQTEARLFAIKHDHVALQNAREAITAIKQARAAPVQEPVAWMQSDEVHISLWKDDYHTIPLYTTPPAAPTVQPVETWEDLHNALQRIDTAAVGLPTFQVRHEGGLDAVVQNIVDAIVALHEGADPPAAPVLEGRDWSLLEATQESLREHMAEIKRLKAAQPAVPDALNPKDENPAYVAGWNDCRSEMLKGMK